MGGFVLLCKTMPDLLPDRRTGLANGQTSMRRREFLKNVAGGTLALAAAQMPGFAYGQNSTNAPAMAPPAAGGNSEFTRLRGVNLGAWLVLEKWMVPKVYRGTDAEDEYNLCLTLGSRARARLDSHRESFITPEDFVWIKGRGLNAVRLPVGYWALEAPKPYIECSAFIDFALDQCQRNGLKLLLDLHGAPGSQNGWDHSGRRGPINWPRDPQNIQETVRVLESFAQKYGGHPALFGIELLNEPSPQIPIEILQQFYQEAYGRLRKNLAPQVAIVIHDSFRPLAWKNFMRGPEFTNVILDTHLYQCFDERSRARTAPEQIVYALDRSKMLDEMRSQELPTLVGEWSLSLPKRSTDGLSWLQGDSTMRGYASAQILNYEATYGWFFWSYKLESDSEWNFRYCVERNWLQNNFAA